jgi:SAM-dependent methyltransferase
MPTRLKSLLKPVVRGVAWPLGWLGLDLRRMATLRFLPRYWFDRTAFVRAGGHITRSQAVLVDFDTSSGNASGHYFHQDLLVARLVHAAAPRRHLDVGSRVDGFVAHVASFREIEVFDIRQQPAPAHPQICFVRADLMQLDARLEGCCDSVSCLHALEHFGLGRYGDPIDPQGHRRGFESLYRLLEPGGTLYLSLPIGRPGVHFNAHRVFDPAEPLEWAAGRLALAQFHFVDDRGELHRERRVEDALGLRYGCGIYVLRKSV